MIEVLKVSGSYADCGRGIGSAYKAKITTEMNTVRNTDFWSQMVQDSRPYLTISEYFLPGLVEEIQGVAQGADQPFPDLFTYLIEELYPLDPTELAKGCTDIIFTPPVSNSVLVGHTNDLPHSFADTTFLVNRSYDDGAKILTIGPFGFYVSAGINNYGIALTGNELSPNDNRVGIPRALIARAILSARTLPDAISLATHPDRASSYNYVITTKEEAVSIEGSGTEHVLIYPTGGVLIHANHYLCASMKTYELEGDYESSYGRQEHAEQMVNQRLSRSSQISVHDLRSMLQAHRGPTGDSLDVCRHGKHNRTIFAMTINHEDNETAVAMGYPCEEIFEKVWPE